MLVQSTCTFWCSIFYLTMEPNHFSSQHGLRNWMQLTALHYVLPACRRSRCALQDEHPKCILRCNCRAILRCRADQFLKWPIFTPYRIWNTSQHLTNYHHMDSQMTTQATSSLNNACVMRSRWQGDWNCEGVFNWTELTLWIITYKYI